MLIRLAASVRRTDAHTFYALSSAEFRSHGRWNSKSNCEPFSAQAQGTRL
jgi:hypothetical protein